VDNILENIYSAKTSHKGINIINITFEDLYSAKTYLKGIEHI